MKDKINHLFAGAIAASFVAMPAYLESGNLFAGIWAAVTAAMVAGGVKEFCDMQTEGNSLDWLDFAFTVLGSLMVVLIILGFHYGKG